MMDRQRLEMEKQVLSRYLVPNSYCFMDMNTSNPYLAMACLTNHGKVYTIRIYLSNFPQSVPEVYVGQMLKSKTGADMDSPSAAMHTLSSRYGLTRICHYGSAAWEPGISLYKVYIRCRLWLEVYELHLKTGKPLDYFLSHAM